VVNQRQDKVSYENEIAKIKTDCPDVRNYVNARISNLSSAESDYSLQALFMVEILESPKRISTDNIIFNNLPKKYKVEEVPDKTSGTFSYVVDMQMNLMATYLSFRELAAKGFSNVRTKIMVISDPAEKELYNVEKIFGTSSDSYFDNNNKLTSTAYLLLDQVVKIMNKYPDKKLDIAIHTDNAGSAEDKLSQSRNLARIISNYLIAKGLDAKRIRSTGYGSSRPVAPNLIAEDRALNRRFELFIKSEL
jgi:outer membrane protein OmpA-like peptidoglycan-associated protein